MKKHNGVVKRMLQKFALPCVLKSTRKYRHGMYFRIPKIEIHHDWIIFIWATGKLVQGDLERRNEK